MSCNCAVSAREDTSPRIEIDAVASAPAFSLALEPKHPGEAFESREAVVDEQLFHRAQAPIG